MPGRALPVLRLPPALILAAGLPAALLLGALIAVDPKRGLGITLALAVLPIVLLDLRIALALYVAIVFVEHLPLVSVGPNATGVAVLIAWLGTIGARAESGRQPFGQRHPVLVAAVLALLVWAAVSSGWAADQGRVGAALFELSVGVVVFFVYATGVTTSRAVTWVTLGFVGGAVLSVSVGLLDSGLTTTSSAIDSATHFEGRLSGGAGDPNYLAAGLVPAMALAGGLLAILRGPLLRLVLLVAIAICGAGLAATQSRGGIIALGAAIVAAMVVARGHRRHVIAVACVFASMGAAWFAGNPAAFSRVVNANDGGNGRSELWSVAYRMFNDHPIVGVGLNNYVHFSRDYAQAPGQRKFGELLTEKPVLVHNAYLQLMAETGVVGLALLLLVLGAVLRATWLAAERFGRAGKTQLSTFSRTLIVAQVGALAASFFLSNLSDKRTWFLLAMGPALLAIAGRTAPGPAR